MDDAPAALPRGKAAMKMNEVNNITLVHSPVFKSAQLANEQVH